MAAADQATAQVDRQIDVYTQLNQFLSAFIDHVSLFDHSGVIYPKKTFL